MCIKYKKLIYLKIIDIKEKIFYAKDIFRLFLTSVLKTTHKL